MAQQGQDGWIGAAKRWYSLSSEARKLKQRYLYSSLQEWWLDIGVFHKKVSFLPVVGSRSSAEMASCYCCFGIGVFQLNSSLFKILVRIFILLYSIYFINILLSTTYTFLNYFPQCFVMKIIK